MKLRFIFVILLGLISVFLWRRFLNPNPIFASHYCGESCGECDWINGRPENCRGCDHGCTCRSCSDDWACCQPGGITAAGEGEAEDAEMTIATTASAAARGGIVTITAVTGIAM